MKQNLLFILLVMASACVRPQGNIPGNSEEGYFNLPALIEDQIKILAIIQPTVNKSVSLDGTQEQHQWQPADTLAWRKELAFFLEADISRPAQQGMYTVSENLEGDSVKVTAFTHNAGSKASGVQRLVVKHDAILNELQTVEVLYKDTNLMYAVDRKMELRFKTDDIGDLFLQTYQVLGSQKMLLSGATEFTVAGTLTYP